MTIAKPFYYDWISIQELLQLIHQLDVSDEERQELTDRILTTIHYEVLDEILSLLPEDEHELFLENMTQYSQAEEVLEPHEVTVEIVETVVKRRGKKVVKKIYIVLTEEA